ncbi:MAG: PH domain-containing protein [Bacillota bacterium]
MDKQKLINRVALGVTALFLIMIGLFVYRVFTTTLDLQVELNDQGIRVQHSSAVLMPAEDKTLSWLTIRLVEALTTKPQLKKINGLDGAVTRIGQFSAEGLGEVRAYIDDLNRKLVLVTTGDGSYLLSPKDAESFVSEATKHIAR